MKAIQISLTHQTLQAIENHQVRYQYPVSTALKGPGEEKGSEQTPRGLHIVRAKIGAGYPKGAVWVGRRFTGDIYTSELAKKHGPKDWILSRILWLRGCQIGFNRLGNCDTQQRYIYIHGVPDTSPMGIPLSHGCIRMHNDAIIELFDWVNVNTVVNIA